MSSRKKRANWITRVVAAGLIAGFFLFILPTAMHHPYSANLSQVTDTLTNSRLSFYALTTANTAGSTTITIGSAGPSDSTAQLASPSSTTKEVVIGSHIYTLSAVAPLGNTSKLTITSGLQAADTGSGNAVIATQSATHMIKFRTASAVPNGRFRVLIKSSSVHSGSNYAGDDGIPDLDGFDAGASNLTVSCPSDITNYDFGTGSVTKHASFGNSLYHHFDCPYTGSGTANQYFNGTAGNGGIISIGPLINPAPSGAHVVNTADIYSVIVQNLSSGGSVVDQTVVKIGVIEGVRLTATVTPQITFAVGGIAAGETTTCGTATNVTTTSTAVPFGEISVNSFTHAAQSLTISTNAVNGYAVTAYENDNLGKGGRACSDVHFPVDCIPDVNSNNSTHVVDKNWTSTDTKGFGYSLKKISSSSTLTPAFERNVSDANCTPASFCAKQFADAANSETAQTLFSSSTVATSEQVNVCYKIVVSSEVPQGDYQNSVVYTATASF